MRDRKGKQVRVAEKAKCDITEGVCANCEKSNMAVEQQQLQ